MDPTGRDRAVYIISIAAELSGVHPQTLRVYERKGLIAPARTGGMSRRYSDTDLERIARVQELTRQGLNLAGVARVLELETEIAGLRTKLNERSAQVDYVQGVLNEFLVNFESRLHIAEDQRFRVYGQTECPQCDSPISTVEVAARRLYLCKHCQSCRC